MVAAGVFNSGVLARDDPAEDAKYNYGPASGEVLGRARGIAAVCRRNGVSLPAAAIAFPLAHPAVVSVCLGARSAEQVGRNVDLYRQAVPNALWSELEEDGLVRESPTRT